MPPGAMHSRQCGHDYVLPNIKFDLHKRHFIACSLFIMSKFYVFVSCVRVLYESTLLCSLLSCVNMCACHVYFTMNLLTYRSRILRTRYRRSCWRRSRLGRPREDRGLSGPATVVDSEYGERDIEDHAGDGAGSGCNRQPGETTRRTERRDESQGRHRRQESGRHQATQRRDQTKTGTATLSTLSTLRSRSCGIYVTLRCPSVCLGVSEAGAHSSKLAAAGLLLWARRAGDVDLLLQQRQQWHVVSVRRRLIVSTDLLGYSVTIY